MRLLEIKAADTLYVANHWHELKFNRNPSAPLAFFQHNLLILYTDARDRLQRVDVHRERLRRRRRILTKGIGGSNQVRCDPIVLHIDLHHFSAFHLTGGGCRIVSVESKRPVSAAQVGRPHAGKRLPFRRNRREIRRNAVHIIGHAIVVEKFPECLAVPQLFR